MPKEQFIELKDKIEKATEKGSMTAFIDAFKILLDLGGDVAKAMISSPITSYLSSWFIIDTLEKISYDDWKDAYSKVERQPVTNILISCPDPDKWPYLDIVTGGNLKTTITAFFAASAATGILNAVNLVGIAGALK